MFFASSQRHITDSENLRSESWQKFCFIHSRRLKRPVVFLTISKGNIMIVKPTVSFLNRQPDIGLAGRVAGILLCMTGNADYPAPSPSLPAVQTALDEFNAAIIDAADGGKTLTARKNSKRKALVLVVRALACYVQAACNGDYAMLVGSGFPTHKPRSPIGVLAAPTRLQVSLGFFSGELDASVAPVFGALTYNWRLTTAAQPDVVVQSKQTSAANVTFTGLTPGVIYNLQASALGTAGPGPWTGPIPKMVV
jgi:hypothetical protein